MPDATNNVVVTQEEAILRVQYNRPQKKNALSIDMYEALIEALQKADSDPEIRVVYLTGSEDSYTAGNDLSSFIANPRSDAAGRFIRQISVTETPIVAAVNGLAVGVGVTQLLHCDLVYVAPHATFNFAFVDLGVVPEAASSYLLPRLVGQRRAAQLMMLGERFDAAAAVDYGIANEMVAADQLQEVAWQRAQQLASKPPEALRQTKMLLKRGVAAVVAETIETETHYFGERLQSAEAQAIMMAFMQRSQRKAS